MNIPFNKDLLKYCKYFKGEEDCPKELCQDKRGLIWQCERNTVETITFNGFQHQDHKLEFQNWVAAYINKWDFSWGDTFRQYFADEPETLKLMLKRYG